MAHVYIIKNQKGRYYIGSTSDLNRRMGQHLSGHTQTTKRMGVLELVFSEQFDSLDLARKVERKLKKLKRKDYIEKIVKQGYIKSLPE